MRINIHSYSSTINTHPYSSTINIHSYSSTINIHSYSSTLFYPDCICSKRTQSSSDYEAPANSCWLGALSEPEYVIPSFHAGIRWDVAKTDGKGTEGSSSLYKQTTSLKKKRERERRSK